MDDSRCFFKILLYFSLHDINQGRTVSYAGHIFKEKQQDDYPFDSYKHCSGYFAINYSLSIFFQTICMSQKFAIGIPTLNRVDLLINALKVYTREFPDIKIFIIDNGDQPELEYFFDEVRKQFDVDGLCSPASVSTNQIDIIRPGKNIGVAASWNLLANSAFKDHEYVIILNDDVILDSNVAMIDLLLNEDPADIYLCESEPGYTGFTSFILPKKTFNYIGGFDETFYPAYYEDNDYLYRLKLEMCQVKITSVLNPKEMFRFGTLKKDSGIDIRMQFNRNHYIKKWGGMPGKECVIEPFGKPNRLKKILWISQYKVRTGYSRVSEALLKHLCVYYDITVVDTERTIGLDDEYEVLDYPAGKDMPPVKVYGRTYADDLHSVERVRSIYQDYDIVFMLHDIWNINMIIQGIKMAGKPIPPIVAYFPIDCSDHDPDWYSNFELIDAAVTYTKFAEAEVENVLKQIFTGKKYIEQINKIKIIEHGVDSSKFYPIQKSKSEIREKIFLTDKFNDCFIFLNANRNQPRKKPELTMDAFAKLLETIPQEMEGKVKLYMHCGNVDDNHINIIKYATRIGISEHLLMSINTSGIPKYTDEQLNMLYNACDVGINTSVGEGFGLVNAEHGMTGAPQIVPYHSGISEFYDEYERRGLLIPIALDYTMSIMTTGRIIDTFKLAGHMLAFIVERNKFLSNKIENEPLLQTHGDNIREYFSGPRFQWKNIAERWAKEVFDFM